MPQEEEVGQTKSFSSMFRQSRHLGSFKSFDNAASSYLATLRKTHFQNFWGFSGKWKAIQPLSWGSRNLHSITVWKVGHYSTEKELKWQNQEWDSSCTSSSSPGPSVIHKNKCDFIFSTCFWRARDKWHSVWNQYLWEEVRDAWWTLLLTKTKPKWQLHKIKRNQLHTLKLVHI